MSEHITIVNGKPMMFTGTIGNAVVLRDLTPWEMRRYRMGCWWREFVSCIGAVLPVVVAAISLGAIDP